MYAEKTWPESQNAIRGLKSLFLIRFRLGSWWCWRLGRSWNANWRKSSSFLRTSLCGLRRNGSKRVFPLSCLAYGCDDRKLVLAWFWDLCSISTTLQMPNRLHTFCLGGGLGFLFFPGGSAPIEAGEPCSGTICWPGGKMLWVLAKLRGCSSWRGAGRSVLGV